MFKDDHADPLNYFRDISTFGGCTAGPAAAIENMADYRGRGPPREHRSAMGERANVTTSKP
jgi:taurine-pyruvate aminotransferase